MDEGEQPPVSEFVTNETFVYMAKFSMDACPQMKYELVVQRKKRHILWHKVQKKAKRVEEN